MKKLTPLALLLLMALTVSATLNQNIQNYYKSDYGFGAKNWMAEQQKNGIIYFANMNGLLSFNGSKWERMPFAGAGNTVRSLLIAQNGDIYIAAQNEFGVFKATANKLENYKSLRTLISQDISFSEIWQIHEYNNTIVFMASDYLFVYDGDSITTIPAPDNLKYSAIIDNSLYLTSNSGGIYVLIGNNFMPLTTTDDLNGKNVCSILSLDENGILFITDKHGAFLYKDGRMKSYNWPINSLLEKYVAYSAKRDNNIIAVGTVQNGVIIYNLSTERYEILNTDNGLQNNTVLGVSFDMEHNLWLCLDRGISYVNIQSPFSPVFMKNNPYGTGYSSLVVGDFVYLATNQGLFVGKYSSGVISDIKIVEGTQGQVYSIKQIDNHLFCCHNNGLYEVTGNRAYKIVTVDGVWDIKRLQKNPHFLIAGCYKGFILLKKSDGRWSFSHKIAGFDESCRQFEQEDSGDIWMAHGLKGIYKISLSDDYKTVKNVAFFDNTKGFKSHLLVSVFEIKHQIVFAAEDGLYKYNGQTELMEIDSTLQNKLLGGGQYFYFNTDDLHRLWFLKGKNIFWAQPDATGEYTCMNKNGFTIPEDLIFEYFSIATLDQTHILVSNEEGFTIVNLNMLNKTNDDEIYVRQITSLANDSILTSQYIKTQNTAEYPKIDYKDNSIRISYGSVHFSSVKNNEPLYSTRLLGYENNWSAPSKETSKEYTNLKEGVYTIQIKSVNNDMENNLTEYTFQITPPFYRTIWAYLIYILLFFCLLFVLYQILLYKEHQIEKQKDYEMLEQKKLHEKESEEQEKQIIALKNEQLESEIEYKSRELAGYTMNLVRKNETLIDVKDELSKIVHTLGATEQGRNTKDKLNGLIRTINDNIEHDDDWKRFEENFDYLHQDFIKRLSECYPCLTINDKKLCAYLKMNLVSKDIAPLLNISLRGVEIGRYRLRKKLNLSRDTNLTDFLQNF